MKLHTQSELWEPNGTLEVTWPHWESEVGAQVAQQLPAQSARHPPASPSALSQSHSKVLGSLSHLYRTQMLHGSQRLSCYSQGSLQPGILLCCHRDTEEGEMILKRGGPALALESFPPHRGILQGQPALLPVMQERSTAHCFPS